MGHFPHASGLTGVDLCVIAARSSFLGALLATFGALLFRYTVVESAPKLGKSAVQISQDILRACRVGLSLAACAWLFWLVSATASIVDARSVGQTLSGMPSVIFHTRFGAVMLAQALALAGLGLAMAWRPSVATVIGAIATALQVGHSHAFAMSPDASWLVVAHILHLLAAGAWLGGLVPLFAIVRSQSPSTVATIARGFSTRLGFPAVATIVVTAVFQASILSGGWSGLLGTPYGMVLLAKAGLLALMMCFAALNRLRLTPSLEGPRSDIARLQLSWSIAVEMVLGLLLVLLAVTLSSLEPGMEAHLPTHGLN